MIWNRGKTFGFNVFTATPEYSRLYRFIYSRARTPYSLSRRTAAIRPIGGIAEKRLTDVISAPITFSGGCRARSEHAWRFARRVRLEFCSSTVETYHAQRTKTRSP